MNISWRNIQLWIWLKVCVWVQLESSKFLDLFKGFVQRICSKDLFKGFVQRICTKDLYKGFVQRICSNDSIKGFVLIWRKVRAVSVCVLPLYGSTRRVQSSSVGVQMAAPHKCMRDMTFNTFLINLLNSGLFLTCAVYVWVVRIQPESSKFFCWGQKSGATEMQHCVLSTCGIWHMTLFFWMRQNSGLPGVHCSVQCTSEFKVLLFWFKGRHHRNTTLDVLF